MNAPGSQLAQSRPSGTTAVTAYTNANVRTEVSRVYVANTTASDATFAIYHDDDGTTYSEATAIVFGATCPANGVIDFGFEAAGGGITIAPGGSPGVKTGTANAITFSVYGVTQ